jgi:hypothetical protein
MGGDVHSPAPAEPRAFKSLVYEAMRRTVQAQREALLRDDLDEFYRLLEEREKLLATMTHVVAEPAAAPLSPTERLALAGIVQEILRLDQENEALLREKIATAQQELVQIASGRQALQRYRQTVSAPGGAIIDQSS